MKSDNDIISDEDLQMITGYKKGFDQCKALEKRGVWFVPADGRPRTTWYHFNHPLKYRAGAPMLTEPDWGAME